MKKFFAICFLFIFAVAAASCSSRPREPRARTSNTGASFQSQNAASDTAYVRSEPMKIWINPIEYQLEVDETVGDRGYIEEIWPKNSSEGIQTHVSTYTGVDQNTNLLVAGVQFKDASASFEKLSKPAQKAILWIIKEYGLDGFFVTMIEEYTGTISQKQQTTKKYKTKDGQIKQDARVTTTTSTRVIVRGIALRLRLLGPVDRERADKVRQTPYIYR